MTYNTLDDSSLPSNSLHGSDDTYEDLNGSEVDLKRAAFGQRTQKDISMDLNDLLQEMEEERDETNSDSSGSTNSASLALDTDDAESIERSERIGSKLELEEFPSESNGMDWGSLNWGSFMGSFKKRMNGSSRRLLRRNSSKKLKTDSETDSPKKRRKSVRFFKFETILPSQESFRRRYSNEGEQDNNRSFSTF